MAEEYKEAREDDRNQPPWKAWLKAEQDAYLEGLIKALNECAGSPEGAITVSAGEDEPENSDKPVYVCFGIKSGRVGLGPTPDIADDNFMQHMNHEIPFKLTEQGRFRLCGTRIVTIISLTPVAPLQ